MTSVPESQAKSVGKQSVGELVARVGQAVGTSPWYQIAQQRIDAFAEATDDRQYIHVDPVRAKAGPFGTTIAHGFLTLSLLAPLSVAALPELSDQQTSVNYGFDRVRFVAPVPADARIRGSFVLTQAEWRSERDVLLRYAVTVEIEGGAKPALVADWLVLVQAGAKR